MTIIEDGIWAAAFAQRYIELRRSQVGNHENCCAWADDAVREYRKGTGPSKRLGPDTDDLR